MDPVLAPLGMFGSAAIGGAVSWGIAKRGKSGRIDTTEAETLWNQAKAMRDELHEEVVSCRTELAEVKKEAVEAKREAEARKDEIVTLRGELADAKMKMADQQMEISELKQHLADATNELGKALTELVSKSETTQTDVGVLKQELQTIQGV